MVSQIREEEFIELQELVQAHSIMQSLITVANMPEDNYESNWQKVKELLADVKLHPIRVKGLVDKYDAFISLALMTSKDKKTDNLFKVIHGVLSKIGREEIDFENKLEFISKKVDEAHGKGNIIRKTSPMTSQRKWIEVYEDYHHIYNAIQQELASLIKSIRYLLMLEGSVDRFLSSFSR